MGRWMLWGLLLWPAVLTTALPVTLTSLQGEVSVYRSGVLIPSEKVREGFGLEPFDTVVTGASGRADVVVAPSLGLAATVKLDPATSVYLDFSPVRDTQTVGVVFLSGALTVSLGAGPSTLEVRTDLAVVSGPKPGWRVIGVDEGDLLVVSRGGSVACQVGAKTVSADGDSAVEVSATGVVRTVPSNPATVANLESAWVTQRQQAFRDQVNASFRTVASDYQRRLGRFQRAWDRYQRDALDSPGGVLAAVANLRRAAGPLERTVVALRVLRRLLDDGVLSPTVELTRGYPAKDFFRQADLDEAPWMTRLVEARGLYRTAADRNGGLFPVARDGSAVTWDSDYFH